jgi:hypothetical protein
VTLTIERGGEAQAASATAPTAHASKKRGKDVDIQGEPSRRTAVDADKLP